MSCVIKTIVRGNVVKICFFNGTRNLWCRYITRANGSIKKTGRCDEFEECRDRATKLMLMDLLMWENEVPKDVLLLVVKLSYPLN
jgi:hypothetical protein